MKRAITPQAAPPPPLPLPPLLRLYLFAAYYSYRGLFAWLTPAMFVAQKVVIPLGQIAFFSLIGAYGGGQPLDFYLVGNAMVTASASAFYVALAIAEERGNGTLTYLLASPANRVVLFLGRASAHVLEAFLHVTMGFAWAMLAFGLDLPLSTWGSVLLVIAVANLAAAGLGLIGGALGYLFLDGIFLGNALTFALLLLSGANIPLSELPPWLAGVSQLLPVTRSIQAARGLAAGAGLAAVLPLLLQELGLGLAYALAGFVLFGWIETQARRRGTLEGV